MQFRTYFNINTMYNRRENNFYYWSYNLVYTSNNEQLDLRGIRVVEELLLIRNYFFLSLFCLDNFLLSAFIFFKLMALNLSLVYRNI